MSFEQSKSTKSLGALIADTFYLLQSRISIHLAEEGIRISRAQYMVLKRVESNQFCSQNDLAKELQRNKSSLKRAVDSLVAKKLIIRKQSKADRRKSELILSPLGQEVLEKITPHLQDMSQLMEKDLSPADLSCTKNTLLNIQESLKKL